MTETWHQAWVSALDALEANVADIEGLIESDHRMRDAATETPWTPPEGLGPIPLDLRPRADVILSRQLAAAQAIPLSISTNRQQAALAARIEEGRHATPSRPAYVDCAM